MNVSPKPVTSLNSFEKTTNSSEKVSGGGFREAIQKFEESWAKSQGDKLEIYQSIPGTYTKFIEGQIMISKLALRTQLLTKAAETASSTLRRVQNFGS